MAEEGSLKKAAHRVRSALPLLPTLPLVIFGIQILEMPTMPILESGKSGKRVTLGLTDKPSGTIFPKGRNINSPVYFNYGIGSYHTIEAYRFI